MSGSVVSVIGSVAGSVRTGVSVVSVSGSVVHPERTESIEMSARRNANILFIIIYIP